MPEDELAKLEIATQLCMGDKTHSQLMDLLPEKSEPMNKPIWRGSAEDRPPTATPPVRTASVMRPAARSP